MAVDICGLGLPDELVNVLTDDLWTAYTEEDRLRPAVVETVFGEVPDPTWKFYSLEEARVMTEEWHQEDDPRWFGTPPDDIEARRSVLIGELGYDRPFALDFRGDHPVVRFMTIDGRWVQVADSVTGLIDALGIEPQCS